MAYSGLMAAPVANILSGVIQTANDASGATKAIESGREKLIQL